ncbi:MAG: isochorismatase family cysteine hydrolase [Dehalococcoidia bacterium]
MDRTAIIVVDMLNDNVYTQSHSGMDAQAQALIPSIQRLLTHARCRGNPVIFANDAFLPDDFIFRETGMKPHAIMGTEGAKVIPEFDPQEGDIILEKRRFSGFMGTNLEERLRGMGVNTIVVAGIGTPVCVLATALDGLAHDFKVIMLEDCCAASRARDHEAIINVYRRSFKGSIFRVMTLDEFLAQAE